jgi:hypothetical protein
LSGVNIPIFTLMFLSVFQLGERLHHGKLHAHALNPMRIEHVVSTVVIMWSTLIGYPMNN